MPVKLVSAGGGGVTLDVPNTGSNFNMQVPARAATLLADDGSGKARKADMPSGSVIQVQETTSTTQITTSNATFVNLFSVSITPASAGSKILLMMAVPLFTSANAIPEMDVMRNGVTIATFGFWQHISSGAYLLSYPFVTHLDSPNTASPITYTVRGRCRSVSCNWVYQDGNGTMVAKITALEIAA